MTRASLIFIVWMLLMVPGFSISGAVISTVIDGKGRPTSNKSVVVTLLFFVPTWWGVYFLILGLGS